MRFIGLFLIALLVSVISSLAPGKCVMSSTELKQRIAAAKDTTTKIQICTERIRLGSAARILVDSTDPVAPVAPRNWALAALMILNRVPKVARECTIDEWKACDHKLRIACLADLKCWWSVDLHGSDDSFCAPK